MSYTFVTAARITLPRKGFDAWLDTPVTTAALSNPESMFAGWYWADRAAPADWTDVATGATPRELVAARVTDTETLTVLRYRDGALEAYLWTVGHTGAWEPTARQLLLMLAGAGAFKDDSAEDHVLFWEEPAGTLPTDSLLALLAVDRRHARFVGKRPLASLLTALGPAEAAFADLAEAVEEDEDGPQPLDPAYLDPAVLRLS